MLWLAKILFCVPKFDAEGEAREIFKKLGFSNHEAAIEAKVVEYLYRFVSNDFKLTFSPKIVVCSLIVDRLSSSLARYTGCGPEDVAKAAGVQTSAIEEVIKQGGKVTI